MQQIIPTTTTILLIGTSLTVRTSYFAGLPNTLFARIESTVGQWNNVPFQEGDLIISMNNHPSQISYSINSNGELIVNTTTGDASDYAIDSNGNLTYDN